MRKIDGCTYDAGNGFLIERMADKTWTSFKPIDPNDLLAGNSWSSPKHNTRQSALRSAAAHLRRIKDDHN